ncbi:MAG: hypothetical protein FWB99_12435, partial [Treponema sp.]|nr:hypothetical protein [Treponema sp.]
MTLSARNDIFKGGIILSALSLILIALGGYFAFSAYPDAMASAAMRPQGIIQGLMEGRLEPSAYVPFFTMLAAVLYSFISILLITHFFEKTQSPEILFFGVFVISLSFEFFRLMVPLRTVFIFPSMHLITASRILLFARYFGLFSLFAASVYAAGLDVQKQRSTFFVLVLAALVIALRLPINSIVWDSTLMPWSAYQSMFAMVEAGILVVTVLTFFISAYTRGSRAYVFIGLGTFLVFTGRGLLINSDTWITPVPGLLALAAGTWLIASRLRQ